jgi:hypothetical protein
MFDHNGTLVSKSKVETTLRTVKKVLHIDSADRDVSKYSTSGDFVVYLPRSYERIVSLRLMSAEFPAITGARKHPYGSGSNYAGDVSAASSRYFLIDLEGLNKTDELSVNANGAGIIDGFFGKIAVEGSSTIIYNDHSAQENIATFSPPIGKLDRLHVRVRTHDQQNSTGGFMYWVTQEVSPATSDNFSMTFEIEYLDNGFGAFSTMETHLR